MNLPIDIIVSIGESFTTLILVLSLFQETQNVFVFSTISQHWTLR